MAFFQTFGVGVRIETADRGLLEEFSRVFAPPVERTAQPVSLVCEAAVEDGWARLVMPGYDAQAWGAWLVSLSSPTVPFTDLGDRPGGRSIGLQGEAAICLAEDSLRLKTIPRWRRIAAHLIYLRALAERPELLFIHAGSVKSADRGLLLVGPKGHGKTTLSVGLALRGLTLLGDETAGIDPARGMLLPSLRPVAIKAGPKPAALRQALEATFSPLDLDEDGIARIPFQRLRPGAESPTEVALTHVVFLRGFAECVTLSKIAPDSTHLSLLQPVTASFHSPSLARHLFFLARHLGRIQCYDLNPGQPDETEDALLSLLAP